MTIDVVKSLFEFGTEPFHALLQKLRLAALEAAAKEDVGIVLMTYCYSQPHSLPQVEQFESIVEKHHGEFLPVYLHCNQEQLEQRVVQPERLAMKKVSTVEGLQKHLKRWNNIAMPRKNCIQIVTDGKTAVHCASEIIERLQLGK